MKKYAVVLSAVALALTLTACGKSGEESAPTAAPAASTAAPAASTKMAAPAASTATKAPAASTATPPKH